MILAPVVSSGSTTESIVFGSRGLGVNILPAKGFKRGPHHQWRNYERLSEAIASGRQAAGGARGRTFGRRIVCFALQNSTDFLKRERS